MPTIGRRSKALSDDADTPPAARKLAREISGRGGDYYVAGNLKVMRGGDLVAEIPQAGPWLLMDLAPGRYMLVGDFGGTEVKRDVVVGHKSTKVSWVLPSSID